jgi:hypothetical protein
MGSTPPPVASEQWLWQWPQVGAGGTPLFQCFPLPPQGACCGRPPQRVWKDRFVAWVSGSATPIGNLSCASKAETASPCTASAGAATEADAAAQTASSILCIAAMTASEGTRAPGALAAPRRAAYTG